jgi:hypothetical protein
LAAFFLAFRREKNMAAMMSAERPELVRELQHGLPRFWNFGSPANGRVADIVNIVATDERTFNGGNTGRMSQVLGRDQRQQGNDHKVRGWGRRARSR